MKQRRTLDSDGTEVKAGDFITFPYGIPPVGVEAPVVEIDGKLIALTVGHKPSKIALSNLKKHVGYYYRMS
jgi:hypothetical protein